MSVKPTKNVQSLKPYVPGEQPQDGGFIKLNTNENPYPPAPEVIEAFRQAAPERLRLYPDPLCVELRTLLAERHKGSVSQIFVGNGSDEVLRLLFQAYLGAGDAIAMVNPTYSLYPVIAAQLGVRTKIFEIGLDGEMPDFPALSSFKVFVIASPNPPYGTFYPVETLERLIKSAHPPFLSSMRRMWILPQGMPQPLLPATRMWSFAAHIPRHFHSQVCASDMPLARRIS